MLNKKMGLKLLFPVVLLLAVLWYQFIYVSTRDQIAAADATRSETEMNLTIEQARNGRRNAMLAELDTLKNEQAVTEIATYDNIQNVMTNLNTVLAAAQDYDLTFTTPVQDEESGLIRRSVSMSFNCADISAAEGIIRQIYASPYRCVIDTMDIKADDRNGTNDEIVSLTEDGVTVEMSVIYYETPA